MLRFVAITALAAALSSPAFAEPGFVRTVSLPVLGSSAGLGPKAACELPARLSAAEPVAIPDHAMTLSPRMLQAIRVDNDASID
ncbi:hypothetical protein [Bosea beijingensis]|uniref:hypothetical protein n=1 Tax=Bosea beijingensis TaxID=3068632 RepID=UPI0027426A26|nr:hypothetical protein [Bosea sp. REN20]